MKIKIPDNLKLAIFIVIILVILYFCGIDMMIVLITTGAFMFVYLVGSLVEYNGQGGIFTPAYTYKEILQKNFRGFLWVWLIFLAIIFLSLINSS